jgi:uncharacterized membrane protein YeaQ/YmgE (transglycosylase-associated protein family)
MSFKGYSHARRADCSLKRKLSVDEGGRNVGLISWIVVGLVAGLLAKWIMPGSEPGGFIVTGLLGMAGASVGGFVVSILGGTGATGFNVWSILVATLGAVLLLFLYNLVTRRAT